MRRLRAWFARKRRRRWHRSGNAPVPAPADELEDALAHRDRGITLVSRAHSLQARLNGLLAGGLAVGILAAMLVWYYGEVLPHAGHEAAASHSVNGSPGGSAPPALGPIPAPHLIAEVPAAHPARRTPDSASGPHPAKRPSSRLARWPQHAAARMRAGLRRPDLISRFSGAVFIASAPHGAHRDRVGHLSANRSQFATGASSGGRLQGLLHPAVMAAVRAQLLPQRRLLLAKGTFIDCTLETAIDSTLPGMTTCITSTDTFSADGTVVLLPRGTQLIGQTRGAVRQGMRRVFVIWTQARTPSGVVVRLDSPATDSLGRSGLTGTVNRHFWERFGAALLVSTLNGVIQSSVQRSAGTVIIDPTAGEDVLTQALRSTEDIAPTVDVPNGQRIEVLVARDVDFRSVYELVAH